MKIGLASDSFGNHDALAGALAAFEVAGVERVFFLGARWADVDAVLARRSAPPRVPASDPGLGFLDAVRGELARKTTGAWAIPFPARIARVASRACPEAASGSAPRKVVELVEGQVACLVHDKAELSRDDIENASLIFHGNSAQAALVPIGPRCFVTPGHLRAPAPQGRPPTFAFLEVSAQEIVLAVHDAASGDEVRRERAPLGARTKLSVR